MKELAQQLKQTIESARQRLSAISEMAAAEKPYAEKWSHKETLGHLLDSCANNHQRIVRMQETQNIGTFRYTQQHWVHSQHYQEEPWQDLVEFWYRFNRHLAHVIANVDPSALNNVCDMGYARPATLKFVMEDYLRHVEHHLNQIVAGKDPMAREKWVRREPEPLP